MLSILKYAVRKVLNKMPSLLETNTAAPQFVVTDHHGNTVDSADLAGTRYVLWFYPKADTPG